ncbi:MAG: 30S ribosomal protein S19 [Planctomycetota bacterium]
MGRSTKKGPFVDEKVYAKILEAKATNSREAIKTWARSCVIVPEFVSHHFSVHNGKHFVKVFVTEDMVGHKLGEFAPTRNYRGHGAGKKDKKR